MVEIIVTGFLFWLACLYLNKDGTVVPKIGGGCFSSKKQPTYNPPPPPKLPTADELFSAATTRAKSESPLAYGARESGLADLAKGNDFYNQFQPTDFESALANQYFQNVFPDVQKNIMHQLSLSGMANSPIAARLIGREQGRLGVDIGSYLSDLGNQRANYSLSSRMGIDPNQIIGPFVNTGLGQGNAQAGMDYGYAQQLAQAQYQQQMNDYDQNQAFAKSIGRISPLAGWGFGGPEVGISSFADNLEMLMPFATGGMGGFSGMNQGAYQAGYGMNTPKGAYDMGSWSSLGRPQPVWNPMSGYNAYGWGR